MPTTKTGSRKIVWKFTADDQRSAGAARREFISYMEQCRVSPIAIHDSELIFGELIGNAIRHVGGTVHAQLALQGNEVLLCVTDGEPVSQLKIPRREPHDESGRGLLIVHALAQRVWVERGQRSKAVCVALPCEVPLRRAGETGEVPA
jgi:anti-sigma regulatory factor (Ser/Thr protein kinase)